MNAASREHGIGARRQHAARGFGLVEVLVTLAVAGIGLLGQALLLQHGLATESAALRHARATTLLAALAERLRANAAARADYALPAGAPAPALPACAASASCTPAESAAADLAEWLAQVAAALPATPAGAAAAVDVITGAAGLDHALITLRWAEPGTSAPAMLTLAVALPGPGP